MINAASKARHSTTTMHPYTIQGKCYTPTYVKIGQTMEGLSSWYGPNFHGKQTSSGEVYNMYARTAAHKTWPIGTVVKVTNLDNGRNTVVRINDRGPFVHGRIIDCSYKAGQELGLDKTGIARVKLEVLGFTDNALCDTSIAQYKNNKHVVSGDNTPKLVLQVGAFKRYEGAVSCQRKYAHYDPKYNVVIKKTSEANSAPLYRVQIMGFKSEQEEEDFIKTIHKSSDTMGNKSI